MERNPWLKRYRTKMNFEDTVFIDALRPEQKMTPLKLQGTLGTAVQRNLKNYGNIKSGRNDFTGQ